MDVALSNTIINTATRLASVRTSDAVNILMLRKAMDVQESAASLMLQTLPTPPSAPLASNGSLGTQLNAWA